MASAPQTWVLLQALQYRTFNEVLVQGVSPFSPWNTGPNPVNPNSASDAVRFGTNPFGTVTSAIYIGVPKDWTTLYPRQCHIIPFMREDVRWRALGGKTFDEGHVYVRFLYRRHDDWYQTMQDLLAARDAMHTSLAKHARLVNAPVVAASREVIPAGAPPAYHHDGEIGDQWDAWGFDVWLRQEWSPLTGIGD